MMRIFRFIGRVFSLTAKKIWSMIKNLFNNIETIGILALATVGATVLITEVPFWFMLPMWIEMTMVAPMLAIFTVWFLVHVPEWRRATV